MMHRPVTICWSRSRGSGFASCAERAGGPTRPPVLDVQLHPQPSATPRTSAATDRAKPLGHIDPNGVDHVPAIALGIALFAAWLHPAERIRGARHDDVRARG